MNSSVALFEFSHLLRDAQAYWWPFCRLLALLSMAPLFNHKNPQINATSLPGLASTAQVSLPKLAQFKFWTLNMVNHKTTKAIDVETNDVFLLNNKKKWPNSKKIYVLLKVD